MNTSVRARKVAREIARRMSIEDGDIVLLKRQGDQIDIRLFNALRVALGKTERKNCVVVVVDNFEDIAAWGEEKLKEYGWCKCEREPIESDNSESAAATP